MSALGAPRAKEMVSGIGRSNLATRRGRRSPGPAYTRAAMKRSGKIAAVTCSGAASVALRGLAAAAGAARRNPSPRPNGGPRNRSSASPNCPPATCSAASCYCGYPEPADRRRRDLRTRRTQAAEPLRSLPRPRPSRRSASSTTNRLYQPPGRARRAARRSTPSRFAMPSVAAATEGLSPGRVGKELATYAIRTAGPLPGRPGARRSAKRRCSFHTNLLPLLRPDPPRPGRWCSGASGAIIAGIFAGGSEGLRERRAAAAYAASAAGARRTHRGPTRNRKPNRHPDLPRQSRTCTSRSTGWARNSNPAMAAAPPTSSATPPGP